MLYQIRYIYICVISIMFCIKINCFEFLICLIRFPYVFMFHVPSRLFRQEAPKPAESTEEDARAERRRRQRQAQEEFRLKQSMKQNASDDEQDLSRNSSTFDNLLLEIPTQTIMMAESLPAALKRPASTHPPTTPKRKASVTRHSITSRRPTDV